MGKKDEFGCGFAGSDFCENFEAYSLGYKFPIISWLFLGRGFSYLIIWLYPLLF